MIRRVRLIYGAKQDTGRSPGENRYGKINEQPPEVCDQRSPDDPDRVNLLGAAYGNAGGSRLCATPWEVLWA